MATDYGAPTQKKGQTADRESTVFYDEHRRPYDVELQKRNLSPCSIPIPLFDAPFYVPPKYLRLRRDPKRPSNLMLGQFQTDYEAWLSDIRDDHNNFQTNLRTLCEKYAPNQVMEALEHPSRFPQIIALCGYPPLSERFVRALRVGNTWATGEVEADPAELVNRRGERLFSDDDIRSLEAFVKSHTPLLAELEGDDEEFLTGDEVELEAYEGRDEDEAQFADQTPATRQRKPRVRRKAKAKQVRAEQPVAVEA